MATSRVHVGNEGREIAMKTKKPRGITNPKNLCYFISSLQCHLQNPHLEQILIMIIQGLLPENNEPRVQFVRALCEFLQESKLAGKHPIKLDNRPIETLHINVCNQESFPPLAFFFRGGLLPSPSSAGFGMIAVC